MTTLTTYEALEALDDAGRTLRHFEIGYDRDYVGIGLHCQQCPRTEDGETALVEELDLDPYTLDKIVDVAVEHLRTVHGHLTRKGTVR